MAYFSPAQSYAAEGRSATRVPGLDRRWGTCSCSTGAGPPPSRPRGGRRCRRWGACWWPGRGPSVTSGTPGFLASTVAPEAVEGGEPADQGDVVVDGVLGGLLVSGAAVAVVGAVDGDLPAVDPAGGVDVGGVGLGAHLGPLEQSADGQGGDVAHPDQLGGDAGVVAEGAGRDLGAAEPLPGRFPRRSWWPRNWRSCRPPPWWPPSPPLPARPSASSTMQNPRLPLALVRWPRRSLGATRPVRIM